MSRRQVAGAPTDAIRPSTISTAASASQPSMRRVRDARGTDQLPSRHGSLRRRAATAAAGR